MPITQEIIEASPFIVARVNERKNKIKKRILSKFFLSINKLISIINFFFIKKFFFIEALFNFHDSFFFLFVK